MNSLKDFNLFYAVSGRMFLEYLLICNVKNILISFAYLDPWSMSNIMKHNNINLICDSGAFTAWNLSQKYKKKGDPNWQKYLVDIDAYVEFLNKHKDIIYRAVNIDVIPGEQGIEPTEEQIIEAAEQGWKNYQYLKSKGFDTIHVFHQGEPDWVLDRMLKECDYIGISPSNDYSTKRKRLWMDRIFKYIADSNNPKIKTHGFAVTSEELMNNYPWFSVDSSSWCLSAAMGKVRTKYGELYVSDRGKYGDDNIFSKTGEVRKELDKYFIEKIGYNISALAGEPEKIIKKCECGIENEIEIPCSQYKTRTLANILYNLEFEEKRRASGPNLNFMNQNKLFE